MFRFTSLVLIAFAVTSLVACAYNPMKLIADNNQLESLSFTTLAHANHSSATAIDVVFIADADVIAQMPATGAAWFNQKDKLLNQHSLGIISIEMAPLTTLNHIKLPNEHASASAIFIYLNMLTDQPLIRIPTQDKCVNITLDKQSVSYKTCD